MGQLATPLPDNPQLGAVIALLSQLWETHYTQNSSFEVLQSSASSQVVGCKWLTSSKLLESWFELLHPSPLAE